METKANNNQDEIKVPAERSPMINAVVENESILRRYLHRFSSSFHDIEDFTQETIYRALKAEETTDIKEPKAFIFGIARNVVRKHLEKKSRSIVDFVESYAPEMHVSLEPLQDEKFEQREQMRLFALAVATLPEQCQKVFVLKKVYGYSHQEISKTLGISISTAEKHVAAGLKRCAHYIDQQAQAGIENSSISITSLKGKQ